MYTGYTQAVRRRGAAGRRRGAGPPHQARILTRAVGSQPARKPTRSRRKQERARKERSCAQRRSVFGESLRDRGAGGEGLGHCLNILRHPAAGDRGGVSLGTLLLRTLSARKRDTRRRRYIEFQQSWQPEEHVQVVLLRQQMLKLSDPGTRTCLRRLRRPARGFSADLRERHSL